MRGRESELRWGDAPDARTCIPAPGVPSIQPNAAQAQAIANAASTVLRKPAAAARGGGGEGAEFDESEVTDLQQDGAAAGPTVLALDCMCFHTTCSDTDATAVRVHVSAAYVENHSAGGGDTRRRHHCKGRTAAQGLHGVERQRVGSGPDPHSAGACVCACRRCVCLPHGFRHDVCRQRDT